MKRRLNVKFLVIFSLICTVICGGAIFAHSFQSRRHADTLFRRGVEAEEKGDLNSALDYYAKYLAFRPSDGAARGRFGTILLKKAVTYRQKESAFLVLERALRDDPTLNDIRRKSIDAAIEIYRFSDARVNIEYLLAQKPGDPDLMELLGRCEEEDGRIPEAIAQYEKVIAIAPYHLKAYEQLAAILTRENKKDQADKVMSDLIEKNPQSIRARLIRFRYFRGTGDLKSAREDLLIAQNAVNQEESETEILLASAELAMGDRKYEEARKLFTRGRQLPKPDFRFTIGLASLELSLGNRAEALKILNDANNVKSENPGERFSVAELLINANENSEAEKILASLENEIEPAVLEHMNARIKMNRGEYGSAIAFLDKCRTGLVRFPDLALQNELLLARCYERLGQPDRQLDACRKALQIDRTSIPARLAIASAQFALGNIDDSIREYQSLRIRYPSVRLSIAQIRLGQSRQLPEQSDQRKIYLDSVTFELDGAPEELKETPDYTLLRTELLIATRKRAEAKSLFEEARKKNPEEVRYWQALASLAAAEGGISDGLAVLDNAREKLGDKLELKLSRIVLTVLGNRPPEELLAYEANLDSLTESNRDRLILELADAHRRLNSPSNAERLLRKLLEYRTNDLAVLNRLFDIVLPKGNVEVIGELADKIRRAEGEDGVEWRFADAYRHWLTYLKEKSSASILIAKSRLEEAGKLRSGWFRVPLLEAQILESTGQIESAIDRYKEAIRLGARDAEVVRRTVQLLVSRRRFDEAREQLNAARAKSSNLTPELNKQAVEIALNERDSSEQIVEAAKKLVNENSKDYRDFLWIGMVYVSVDRKNEAESALRRACELGPDQPETITSLVSFLVRNDRIADAKREIERAKSTLPPEKQARALAACYETVGDKAEAEKLYIALEKESPNDLGIMRSRAIFHLTHGELDKAAVLFRKIIDYSEAGSELRRWARRTLAIALATTGEFARTNEALTLIQTNLSEKPGSPEELRARALVQSFRPGRRQQSIRDLEDSFAKFLPSPNEEFILARLYELDGDWLNAKNRFESLLTKPSGRNPQFFAHYIRGLLKRDDLSNATLWFNKLAAIEQNRLSPFVVEMKARILAKEGNKPEAANQLKTFAAEKYKEKPNPNIWRDVGRLLAELKLTADAEVMLRQYVKEVEMKSPSAVLILAEFLAREDRVADAIRLCSQSLKTAGPELSALIAASAVRLGQASPADFVAAGAVIDDAIRQMPKSLDLQVSLAELRDAQGRYNDAIEGYRNILIRDPKNDIALNNLAWLLTLHAGKPAEALELIDRAISSVGAQPNLLDTRGVILMALGRNDEAITALADAAAQARTPEVYYHLALAQHKAGQRTEAARTIRQAREVGFSKKYLHPLEIKDYDEFVKINGEDG